MNECPDCTKLYFCDYHCHQTSTLNGKWPSDTWFRRALARKLQADAKELELKADSDELPKV